VNSADNFLHICGEITFASRKRALNAVIKRAYFLNFGCKVRDQDKSWVPRVLHILFIKPQRFGE
jgi:hypothetical protein